jgi:hypothetical protein
LREAPVDQETLGTLVGDRDQAFRRWHLAILTRGPHRPITCRPRSMSQQHELDGNVTRPTVE